MKSLKLFFVLICVLLPQIAMGQGYVWHPISADNAVQIVQTFENNSTLGLTILYSPNMTNAQPSAETYYRIQSSRYEYMVGAFCSSSFSKSDILFYTDPASFYGQAYDNDTLAAQAMSQSSARAIASAFMQAHYPNPSILTNMTVIPHIASKSSGTQIDFINAYEFDFGQDCGNGVFGPSDCSVEVDTVKGQIVSYGGHYFPALISSVPTLTPDQAMASAMNGMQIQNGLPGTVDGIDMSFPDAFGNEQLIYSLNFTGMGPAPGSTPLYDDIFFVPPSGQVTYSQSPENYVLIVDANSGNVINWGTTLSASQSSGIKSAYRAQINSIRKLRHQGSHSIKQVNFLWAGQKANLSFPAILRKSATFFCADYLCYNLPEAKIASTKGKQLTITTPTRSIALNFDSLSYQANGQIRRMSSKPVLVSGHWYVPLDVMNAVLPGKFTYDANMQTVRYDPPPKKTAQR